MKTSACGWPEPSTGISFPRGQCGPSWRSWVSWLSSRIARSRYFSLISSSVAGTLADLFDESAAAPLARPACISSCSATAAPRAPAPHRFRVGRLALRGFRPARRLQQLQGLDVDQVLVLAGDVGVAHRLEELLRPLELVDPHPHAAERLGDVTIGPGAGNDPVLAGKPLGLLVERGQRDTRIEDLEDVDL